MPKKEIKYKYKIGQIVYCRPWVVTGNGMSVYKCKVTQQNHFGGRKKEQYYSLQVIGTGLNLFIKYEREISKRKERLVREALKEVNKKFGPAMKWRWYYLKRIHQLK